MTAVLTWPESTVLPTVVVIDDDDSVREGLEALLDSVGLACETFGSVQDYLAAGPEVELGCMVLDVRLPGRSGIDFHDSLVRAGVDLPVIFISGHADVPMSVRAMKAGAWEFLTKPVRHQELLDAIHQAIEHHRARRRGRSRMASLRARFDSLTPRERDVAAGVTRGLLNKQIAGELGLSEATVKLHRGNLMRKMEAGTMIDLVRMLDQIA
ncbi:response regulator transcription factor (plasmid) [Paroceanicella profunda]|uniref:Response regulator transcription factor n=1 Tax=Paroceanicella profunda TaxID=2579971 RepID=A0A5B8FK06_9RHOB|nr:response regulator [Paroceanicella profunda]QDL94948.1 response regulator transcription factor [Paroceanicella profunda]